MSLFRIITCSAGLLTVVSLGLATPAAAQWTPLTLESIEKNGRCGSITASSPYKEYYDIECEVREGKEFIEMSNFTCKPKGVLKDAKDKCDRAPLECKLVIQELTGKTPQGWAKMYEASLLINDKAVVKKLFNKERTGAGWYMGGDCFAENNYWWRASVLGLGIVGKPEQLPSLLKLIGDKFTSEEIEHRKDEREEIAKALWWIGSKAEAAKLMTMLDIEYLKKHKNEKQTAVLLAALAVYESDVALELCGENMTDIQGREDLFACFHYLGMRGAKQYVKSMIRNSGRLGSNSYGPMGKIGGKEIKKYLEKLAAKEGDGRAYLSRDIARYNAGGNAKLLKAIKATLDTSGRPDIRVLSAFGYLVGNKKGSKAVIKLLRKVGNKHWKDKSDEYWAYSLGIQHHLGDKKAMKDLLELLESPDADTRRGVVRVVGGSFFRISNQTFASGVIADEKLLKALVEARKHEGRKGDKILYGNAILNVRAALRAGAGATKKK